MKDKKTTLKKKLKSYSALAGSLVAVANAADGQVVYTNVVPDSTVAGGIYNLDLNNDGVTDFVLAQQAGTMYGFSYNAVAVAPQYTLNSIDTAGGGFADAVAGGFSVDSTLKWVDSTNLNGTFGQILAASVPTLGYNVGNFLGQNGKFLPCKFSIEGPIYYGWVRLNVSNTATSFTVIDYAYKNNIQHPSITGLTTDVGIAESALNNKVNIFAFDKNITVEIDNNLPIEGTITVSNILGQVITKVGITDSKMVIPMSSVKTGTYLVTITQSTGSYTKKVNIQ